MNEENEFDRLPWQRAFEEEAMPPPPDLWSKIEEKLDEEEAAPVAPFMWWRRVSYTLGGLAAMLLVAAGLYYLWPSETVLPTTAEVARQSGGFAGGAAPQSDILKTQSSKANIQAAPAAVAEKPTATNSLATATPVATASYGSSAGRASNLANKDVGDEVLSVQSPDDDTTIPQALAATDIPETTRLWGDITLQPIASANRTVEPYATRFEFNQRQYIPVPDYSEAVLAQAESSNSESRSSRWIGLQSEVSPFAVNSQTDGMNTLAVNEARQFAADANNYNVTNASFSNTASASNSYGFAGQSRTEYQKGQSFSLGLRAGQRLTERLAVETGLRYFKASNSFSTNSFVFNATTGDTRTFYEAFLQNTSTAGSTGRQAQNVLIMGEENFASTANYVVVPLQLVYSIPLAGDLKAELVGGITTDVLLDARMESPMGTQTVLNAGNSLFRLVNFSGAGGLRLAYWFGKKWQFSLGATGQRALRSAVRTHESTLAYTPGYLGIQYGVTYGF